MKKAVVTILTTAGVPADIATEKRSPDEDAFLVVLGHGSTGKGQDITQTLPAVLDAQDLGIQEYCNKAFFWSKEVLAQYLVLVSVENLLQRGYDTVSAGINYMPIQNIVNEVNTDTIFLCVSHKNDQSFASNLQNELSSCTYTFFSGGYLPRFLRWCRERFDYLYRHAVSTIDDREHTGLKQDRGEGFYFEWPLYGASQRVAVFQQPVNLQTDKNMLAERYPYSRFTDGTRIHKLLRQYFVQNYRLRLACENDPFSKRELFTDTSVIPGQTKGAPLIAMAECIWKNRPDLQALFPRVRGEHRLAFLEWYINEAQAEYMLEEVYFSVVREELQKEGASGPSPKKFQWLKGRGEAAATPHMDLEPGVTFGAHIRGDYGIGEAARRVASALEAGEVPFTIVDIASETNYNYTSRTWNHKITNDFPYRANLLYTNADGLETFMADISPQAMEGRYNIGYWAWELPEFPPEPRFPFEHLDEVWTLSDFSAEAIRAVSPLPVYNMPHPIVLEPISPLYNREYFGLPPRQFLFLMMYDTRSVEERKNPWGSIQAFQQAFKGNKDVGLVIKINAPVGWKDNRLAELVKNQENIYLINQFLSRRELDGLLHSCDAFLSLHRSEGFGFGPAEAMYLGKPAVLTNWSGNTEYMRPDTCCAVPYSIIEIDKNYGPYKKGWHWADPHVIAAADMMKKLTEDTAYRESIAAGGQRVIKEKFSPHVCSKKIKVRLNELKLL